jgi:hypothetical protein
MLRHKVQAYRGKVRRQATRPFMVYISVEKLINLRMDEHGRIEVSDEVRQPVYLSIKTYRHSQRMQR